MAAELVGTAYVRIRAITAGLASDIKDGVDKGVKDADIDKAGEKLGGDLGGSTSEGFGKSLADGGIADGLTDALDAPEVHKASEEGGKGVAKDVSKGIDDEHKRSNPFRSMLDALKNLDFKNAFKDKFSDVDPLGGIDLDLPGLNRKFGKAGEDSAKSYSDGMEKEHTRRHPFRALWDGIKFWMPKIEFEFDSGGEESGAKFSDGVERGVKKKNLGGRLGKMLGDLEMPKALNWAGIFGPTTLAPIIGGITSGIGLIVESLGFVITAAAGAGLALAGIAAVAAPGLGVLLAAFKVQTKQLERFQKNVKKLLKPWEQVGVATQEKLLPGIEKLLEKLQFLVPLFIKFGGAIGETIGSMAQFAGGIFTSERNMTALGKILESSEAFFINIRTAVLNVADALLPFLANVAPLAVQFSESLKNMAVHLADIIKQKDGTGELRATFQTWYERAELLAGILGDVFVGLWNILQIAGTSGAPFFDKIAEAAETFRAWTSSAAGQNKIKKFFEDIQPVLDEVWTLLGNLFDLIIKPAAGDGGATMFSNLAAALHAVNTVLENPVTAQVVPYLLGLVVALGLLSKVPTPILSGIGSGLWWVVDKTLINGLKGLSSIISELAKVAIRSLITALWELSAALLTTPAGWVLLAVAAAAIAVYEAFIHWDTIVGWLKTAWEWFDKLSLPVKIIVGAFAALVALTNPIVWFAAAVLGITAALKNWDKIAAFVDRLWDTIYRFFTNLPTLIPQALDAIVKFVTDLPAKLAPLGETIINFFKEIPGKIKDALITGLENLPSAILDALGGLFDLGQNLLGLIADGIMFAAPKLLNFFITLPVKIFTTLGTVLPKLLSIGITIIGFILKGLAFAVPRLLGFFIGLPFEILTLIRKGIVALVKLGAELIAALFRGIVRAGPKIGKWFSDLPGNLLDMLETGLKWLLKFGGKMIGALIDGVIENAGRLWEFFTNLPSTILGLLGDLGSMLLDVGGTLLEGLAAGAESAMGSISEFFGGLPQKIVDFVVAAFGVIVDVGSKIPGWIRDGVVAAAQTLWDWFTGLPQAILDLLTTAAQLIMDLGGDIIGWVAEGLATGASAFWDWFTGLPGAIWDTLNSVVSEIWDIGTDLILWILVGIYNIEKDLWDWFLKLPGTIWDTLNGIISEIWGIGSDLIKWVVEGLSKIPDLVDWFLELPGKIWDTLKGIISEIWGIGKDIIKWILEGVWEVEKDIWHFFEDLPGTIWDTLHNIIDEFWGIGKDIVNWIIEGIGDLGSRLWEVLKTAWNWVADRFQITIPIPFADDIHISAPHLTMGGVFPGSALGIPVTIAEGGRAEAVVPMTRPARALAVMQEAGLDKLVLDAYMGGSVPAGASVVGDTTMLHIDTAIMTAPVDADMIVQKVTAAYNRIAS